MTNDIKEVKNILSHLKKDYGKNPFNEKKMVESDFLFYVVDRYLTMQKKMKDEIKKVSHIIQKDKKNIGEFL